MNDAQLTIEQQREQMDQLIKQRKSANKRK